VLDDVTEQVQQQRQLLALRVHDAQRTDSLTQMPNRAAMRERLASVLAAPPAGSEHWHRPPHALLFLNCDRFKQVNDLLGPAGGDDLLQLMAKRLLSALRQEDLVAAPAPGIELARVGGDEFVVLLCGVADRKDALSIGHRLVHTLGQPYRVAAQAVTCSVSVGLLWWDGAASLVAQGSGGDADALLRDTGLAMVQAKRLGGGQCVLFEPDMRESAQRRSSLEADLRAALQGQQLFVAYQPVVSLQGDAAPARCVGVEALVRWRHPVRGYLSPQDFIALAEACGLIDAIGGFVLDTALRHQQHTMQRLGPAAPAWTAVNLSRAQLRHRGFVDKVRDGLRRHGLQATHLHLEVTESLAAQDPTVQAALCELRALGICLALDDFGTGYSSLSSLHQLPVQVVKIDRSFTNQVDTSAHHRVLVEATVKVARSLGMQTVVEGIETTAQAAIVQALGCDMGQGYLYRKALSSDELHDWLAHAAMQDAGA
jgi:diguanylate cyclase (GGDEF)-like protein